MIFPVENEVKNNWKPHWSERHRLTILQVSIIMNIILSQLSDSTVKVPGNNASRKKKTNSVKQHNDSNSYFSKVICKGGYYHLLSFLNNQDQPLDKLWKIICCVLCVACLWGYLGLQAFIFIRLSILYKQSFCISPGW